MAAMNHFVHPFCEDCKNSDIGVYGDSSTKHILDQLFILDDNPSHYSAVLLGGGMNGSKTNLHFGISAANIKSGISVLDNYKIKMRDINTSSNGGIKVIFDTLNNQVSTYPLPYSSEDNDEFRVLIVEDSPSYGQILKSTIESNPSFKVIHISEDIFDARKCLVHHRPDCMTLDINLPGMDGRELLRSVMKHFPLPVVVISGINRNFSEIKKTCLDFGAAAVLKKETINLESEIQKDLTNQLVCNTLFNAILHPSK
jgi:CheY-like chemotaxis protein/chemotaxis receptor (MCP) glutamine deamidase CheD